MDNRMKILETDDEKLVFAKALDKKTERKKVAVQEQISDAEKREKKSHKKSFSVWRALAKEIAREDKELDIL